jgi:hypothetical protein
MEVQSQIRIEEALREQRDRHADALERVSYVCVCVCILSILSLSFATWFVRNSCEHSYHYIPIAPPFPLPHYICSVGHREGL